MALGGSCCDAEELGTDSHKPLRYVRACTYDDSGELLETYTTGQAWPYHERCMEQWNIATESNPWTPEILGKTFSKLGMRSPTTWCLRGIDYGIMECFVGRRWGSITLGFDDILQPPSPNSILDGFYRCLVAEAYVGGMSATRLFGSEDSPSTSPGDSSTIGDSPEQLSLIRNVNAAVDLFLQRIQQNRAEETEPHGRSSLAGNPWAEDAARPPAEVLAKFYEDSIRQFPQKREHGQARTAYTLDPSCTSESSDPFYNLGPALILCIVDFLHIPDLCRLRKASRPCARLRLSFGFWRARLRKDMPFLYDFVAPKDVPLDWRLLYMVLDGMSSRSQSLARQRDLRSQHANIYNNLPSRFRRPLSCHNLNVVNITLLNRRRIWESIGQIIDSKAEDDGGLNEWILEKSP